MLPATVIEKNVSYYTINTPSMLEEKHILGKG